MLARVRLVLRPNGALALGALALALGACGEGTTAARVASVRQANQGTATTSHPYAVGVCINDTTPDSCAQRCSGTLVAPNLVLTARHCVDALSGGKEVRCGPDTFTTRQTTPATTWVTTQPTFGATGWKSVSEIRTPTSSNDGCAADIALLVLNANVSSAEAAPADVLAFGPMTDHSRYSTELTVIGYGNASGNQPNSSGTRRIMRGLRVDCIPDDPIFALDSFCKGGEVVTTDGGSFPLLDKANNFGVPYGPCSGDSGSGGFEETAFRAGKPLVMGVLARGSAEGANCVAGAYTRTDVWRDFLVQGATAAAAKGGYALPAWASGPVFVAPPDADAGTIRASDAGGADGGAKVGAGAVGATCKSAGDCASGACVAVDDGDPKCASRCDDSSTCGAGQACVTTEGGGVCVEQTKRSRVVEVTEPAKDGCAVGSQGVAHRSPRGWAAGLFVLAALLAARSLGRPRGRS